MTDLEFIEKLSALLPKYKKRMWAGVSFIVVMGLVVSCITNDLGWLGKAGALTILIPMILEASDVTNKSVSKTIEGMKLIIEQVIKARLKEKKHLYGLSGNETDEQLTEKADVEIVLMNATLKQAIERGVHKDLRKHEFMAASIGTLLWAFC